MAVFGIQIRVLFRSQKRASLSLFKKYTGYILRKWRGMSYYKSERIIPVWVKVMLSLFIFLLLFMFAVFLIKEIDFKNTPYVEQECRLLSIEYSPSTEKTRLAPIIG